jgi:thiol:disulfide interchange protein DsbC
MRHLPILLLLSVTALARAEVPTLHQIDAMASLPVTGLKAVESDGRLLFMSDNGRFVIDGTLYDVWAQQPLTSLASIRSAGDRLDLRRLGLPLDDLQALTLGEGAEEVLIFVDPRCPHCHALLKQADQLQFRYTFRILPVAVLGPESEHQVRQLGCALEPAAALLALTSGRFAGLPQRADCDLAPLQRTLVTAQLLGVKGVPFIVAPDGRISRGRPHSLREWLEFPG